MSSIAVMSMIAYRLRWKPKFPKTKFFRDAERSLEEPGTLKFDTFQLTFGDWTLPYSIIQGAILYIRKDLFNTQQMLWFETETCLYVFLLREPYEGIEKFPFQVQKFESSLSIRDLKLLSIELLIFLPIEIIKEIFYAPLNLHNYKSNPSIGKFILIIIDYLKIAFVLLVVAIVTLNIYRIYT